MIIKTLTLQNYRNYHSLTVSFSSSLNIFIGNNGQGKTNLLESIYVLSATRSHRTTKDGELLYWQEENTLIQGEIEKQTGSFPLSYAYSAKNKGKILRFNHLIQKKASEYIGQFHVILFCPDDLFLIKGSPSQRRKFLDQELGFRNRYYLQLLSQYQKLLKERNQCLQKGKWDALYLDILDEQLSDYGSKIMRLRADFLNQLGEFATEIYRFLTQEKEELTLTYLPSIPLAKSEKEQKEVFLHYLQKNREKDQQQRATKLGIQRDDWILKMNNKEAKSFASQGQQRLLILSIKLAEVEYIAQILGEYPVLLLDDVMSELDDERQMRLLQILENRVQTFITTTTLEHLEGKMKVKPKIFEVKAGEITTISEE